MWRSPNLAFPDESDKRMKPKADIFTPVSDSTFNQRAYVRPASRSCPYIGGLPAGRALGAMARRGRARCLSSPWAAAGREGLAFVRTAGAGAWTGYGERTDVGDAPPFPADRAGVRSYFARCAVAKPTSHSYVAFESSYNIIRSFPVLHSNPLPARDLRDTG